MAPAGPVCIRDVVPVVPARDVRECGVGLADRVLMKDVGQVVRACIAGPRMADGIRKIGMTMASGTDTKAKVRGTAEARGTKTATRRSALSRRACGRHR